MSHQLLTSTEGLCPTNFPHLPKDCVSQSQQPDSWTPWKVENAGISEPELLVAADVKVYQPVHIHV